MEQIWERLYNAAKAVQNPREISERIYAGGVAAAVESVSGRIYRCLRRYILYTWNLRGTQCDVSYDYKRRERD